MDSITQRLMMGAAGGAGAAKIYVEDVFSTWLYTGNGSTQTITNGIDLSGKGGLVWTKERSSTGTWHQLRDTARGSTKTLYSNDTSAQLDQTAYTYSSSGYSIGGNDDINLNTKTYASWTFRKAAKFFDVVSYTGSGANRTIAHSLGSVPGTIIVKRTDNTGDWQVYHRSLANTEYMVLNSTAAKATGTTRWNSTTPTSTEFSLGTDATINASGGTYVAYLFAHDAGGFGDSGNDNVVSCGSFTEPASGSTTVTLGWEPQFVLIKPSNAVAGWYIFDNMRTLNYSNNFWLQANASSAESTSTPAYISPTSTGFTFNAGFIGSGTNYIYIAIRRGPMKTPTDATKVFAPSVSVGGFPSFVAGFPVDFNVNGDRSGTDKMYAVSRLTGTAWMQTNTTAAEGTSSSFRWDSQTGCVSGWPPYIGWSFRRAPGFFDAVVYAGTGSARTVSHNLGVAPELMIVKNRSAAGNSWPTYDSLGGASKYMSLNNTNGHANDGTGILWNSTAPTSSVFSLGTNSWVNASTNTYIAYLFASCPGVSKVGSYTGTGTTKQIDCGFTNGARFVLIKRTDSTGDWYVWDTARGIIAANDPYLLLNSTAAEVTNTDYIDPLNSGFEISSTAPAAINANGGTYIYLAIA